MSIKIVAGKYKGHLLVSFSADHIRPTLSQVKETLFNKLMYVIGEAEVLDLFCGTGSLGLESLSRGAQKVTFIDKHPKSIQITLQNIEKLKIPKDQFDVNRMDVISFLKKYSGPSFGIILIDPPFTEKMAHEVMTAVSQSQVIGPHTIIAIESLPKERLEENYGNLVRFDMKKYSDKILSFFKDSTMV